NRRRKAALPPTTHLPTRFTSDVPDVPPRTNAEAAGGPVRREPGTSVPRFQAARRLVMSSALQSYLAGNSISSFPQPSKKQTIPEEQKTGLDVNHALNSNAE